MKTPRNAKYLAYIRDMPCCHCGGETGQKTQAAHVRIGNGGGMGLKPSDYRTVPLCFGCHTIQHQHGERSFWQDSGLDPDALIARYMLTYIDDTKAVLKALESILEAERGQG